MNDAIVEQYEKHGWTLQRILLTKAELAATSDELKTRFPNAVLVESDIDAIWFSRPNRDAETWELRRLSGTPFALLEVFEGIVADGEREDALRNIEQRMAESLTKSNREIALEK
jgi:hypothetical protein